MSTLISRDGVVGDDPWRFLADEDEAGADGDIAVSFVRFRDTPALAARRGRLGVVIAPADRIEEIADRLSTLSLIAISFPGFRDGRGYSTARLARERYDYKGELRAIGDVLEDQLFFMLRCGFDSFALKSGDAAAAYGRAVERFTLGYQATGDGLPLIHALRAARRAQRAGSA